MVKVLKRVNVRRYSDVNVLNGLKTVLMCMMMVK